jgi:hypothetical protein
MTGERLEIYQPLPLYFLAAGQNCFKHIRALC